MNDLKFIIVDDEINIVDAAAARSSHEICWASTAAKANSPPYLLERLWSNALSSGKGSDSGICTIGSGEEY